MMIAITFDLLSLYFVFFDDFDGDLSTHQHITGNNHGYINLLILNIDAE